MVLKKVFTKSKNNPKQSDISEITELKIQMALRNAVYKVSDRLKNLCFNSTPIDSDGFVEYIEGFRIKNLSSEYLESEGLSVFKVKAMKNITIDLHNHKTQSQTIMVKKGRLTILDSNIEIFENESFFIKKNKEHRIKYSKDSEVIIIYLPNLERLN